MKFHQLLKRQYNHVLQFAVINLLVHVHVLNITCTYNSTCTYYNGTYSTCTS